MHGFKSERRMSNDKRESSNDTLILPEIPKYKSKKKLASLFKSMS